MNTKYPQILDKTEENKTSIVLRLLISTDIIFFQGHFPGTPILPGITQYDWALYFAQKYFNIKREEFLYIEQLKFTKAITPDTTLSLEIKLEDCTLTFKYFNSVDGVVHSLGKIKK